MFALVTLLMLLCYHPCAHSIPINISLAPTDDSDGGNNQTGKEATCTEVKCPELDCKEVIQEEGKCCKSCDTSGATICNNQ